MNKILVSNKEEIPFARAEFIKDYTINFYDDQNKIIAKVNTTLDTFEWEPDDVGEFKNRTSFSLVKICYE